MNFPPRQSVNELHEFEPHPGLNARLSAASIIRDVVQKGQSLDRSLAHTSGFSQAKNRDLRDSALVHSIVTTALRHFGTINEAILNLLKKSLPRQASHVKWDLITAAAQILFLDIPDHAAVDLAVKAVRLNPKTAFYASLVNAVLRNLIRQRSGILAESNRLEADTPGWLAERWKRAYGDEAARQIAIANGEEPTLDLTVKSGAANWAERLEGTLLPTGSVRLETHRPIHELEGYEDGEWWVQDAAAALPAQLIGAKPGMRVGDFCAAPGGKTAQLAMSGARVTAIDRSADRLKVLTANLQRLRLHADIIVGDASNICLPLFDAILVDAPCSSTGTIRRHPDIAWTKQSSDLFALAHIQKQILANAEKLLKPGGTLLYCTCSIEPEEGEMQIEALLRRRPDFSRLPIEPHEIGGLTEILNRNGEVRSLPFHLKANSPRQSGLDGFFIGRVIRND